MKFKSSTKLWNLFPVILLLCTFLFITSCGSDDETLVGNAGNGVITMEVDGVSWTSKDEMDGAVIFDSQGSLQISGFAEDGSQISFGLAVPNQGDTWDFSSGGAAVYKLSLTDSGWSAAGGIGDFSITFSTYNNDRAQGSFGGTLVKFNSMGNPEELVISNGSFDLNF